MATKPKKHLVDFLKDPVDEIRAKAETTTAMSYAGLALIALAVLLLTGRR